ncbi:hypothetical protein Micbo1qcDRAFT_161351 [Microdochium bolleyi]|uniref:Ca3427-like PBP 2 domain-containing protein n=1 Tax=Microdochium bolleyi TaxID=196109 RepID=A0A136J849_9PEZI|nr:hypothetical protein Micbo1qcDRAFT_161351 [Microdochium bolleyi]
MAASQPLRVGFVPEHFSTPIHFARKYFGLDAELIPFPSGSGHMIVSLRAGEIDIACGLTEAWIAGLGKTDLEGDGGYRIVGNFVETPLCWAVSTGANRADIKSLDSLKGGKLGISRIGSGSHVMAHVLADQQGWSASEAGSDSPYADSVVLQNFANLRAAVSDGTADFFMWEHFTSKRYFDNGEIRRLGDIYTPWPSWHIVAATSVLSTAEGRAKVKDLFAKLDQGIEYFLGHQDEAVQYISTALDYSEEDAREWLKTVRFSDRTEGVKPDVVQNCMRVLWKAGVLVEGKGLAGGEMFVDKL